MIPSEHSEHAGFMIWFRQHYPSVLCFHIPNGEWRSISTAKRLKAAGVVRGIPDIFIPKYRIWLEMKRSTGGNLSDEQKEIHRYLRAIGDTVIVGYGAEDASRKVLDIINKL